MGKDWGRPKGSTARRRATRHRRLKADERENKAEVRRRDGEISHTPLTGWCRFPLCGCHDMDISEQWPGAKAFVEVSHFAKHKGMGGDPTGERSTPDKMICLCNWRHKAGRIAVDQGALQCRPMTDGGANGPVAWWVSVEDLMNQGVDVRDDGEGWMIVAYEIAPGELGELTPDQREVLAFLAGMEF